MGLSSIIAAIFLIFVVQIQAGNYFGYPNQIKTSQKLFEQEFVYYGSPGEDVKASKDGKYVYFSERINGIKVFDFFSATGKLVAYYKSSFETTGIALSNDEKFLFIVLNGEGLKVLKIEDQSKWLDSDPFELEVVAIFNSLEKDLKSVILDKYDAFAYFSEGSVGLKVFDVSKRAIWIQEIPTVLKPVSQILTASAYPLYPSRYEWVHILSDNKFFAASNNIQISIFKIESNLWDDINDVKKLEMIAYYYKTFYSSFNAITVSPDDNYLYASTGEGIIGFSLVQRNSWTSNIILKRVMFAQEKNGANYLTLLTDRILIYTINGEGTKCVQLQPKIYSEDSYLFEITGQSIQKGGYTARFSISPDKKKLLIATTGFIIINISVNLDPDEEKSLIQYNTVTQYQVSGTTAIGNAQSFKAFAPGYIFFNYESSYDLIDMTDGKNNLLFGTENPIIYPALSKSNDVDSFNCSDLDISSDQQYLLVANREKRVLVIDISDQSNWNSNLKTKIIANLQFNGLKTDLVRFSPDNRFAFVFQSEIGVKVFDISDKTGWVTTSPPNIEAISLVAQTPISIGVNYEDKNIAFSRNGNFLYVPTSKQTAIEVYDLRDQSNWVQGIGQGMLKRIAKWVRTDGKEGANRLAITPDNFFLLVAEQNRLVVFDIRKIENIVSSQVDIDMNTLIVAKTEARGMVMDVVVSSNNKFAYFAIIDYGIVIADIRDQSQWTGSTIVQIPLLGSIKAHYQFTLIKTQYLQLFGDDKFLIVGNKGLGGTVISLERDKFLQVVANDQYFTLGKPQQIKLIPYQYNDSAGIQQFYPEVRDYQVREMKENFIDQNGLTTQKDIFWASQDFQTGSIYLTSSSKQDVGVHSISMQVSYEVPEYAFIGLNFQGNPMDFQGSIDLVGILTETQFLDQSHFVERGFILEDKIGSFSMLVSEEEQFAIRKVIGSYFLQYACLIEIRPSLNVTQVERNFQTKKMVKISTISTKQISFVAEFAPADSQASKNNNNDTVQFMVIRNSVVQEIQYLNQGRKIVIKGMQSEINLILSQIQVNVKRGEQIMANESPADIQPDFEGYISIDDQLNNVFFQNYSNLLDLFLLNSPPQLDPNKKLMSQFTKKVSNFQMGVPFTFEIEKSTFIDTDDTLLTLTIANITQNTDGESQVLKVLPSWLSFNGDTRGFEGTPTQIDTIYHIFIECSDGQESTFDQLIFNLTVESPKITSNPSHTTYALILYSIDQNITSLKVGRSFSFTFDQKSYQNFNQLSFKVFISNSNYPRFLSAESKALNNSILEVPMNIRSQIVEQSFKETLRNVFPMNEIANSDKPNNMNQSFKNPYSTVNSSNNLRTGKSYENEKSGLKNERNLDNNDNDENLDGDSKRVWIELGTDKTDNWLNFDQNSQKLFGIPRKQDLHPFEIQIISSNGLKQSEEIIGLNILNQSPLVSLQLENQFQGIEVPVNEPFSIQFAGNTFLDPDLDVLEYQLKIEGYSQHPNWVKFKPNIRTIELTAPNFETIKLILTASDPSEAFAETKLELHIVLTALYIFNMSLIIGGPLISAIGVIRYRAQIYNLLCFQFYQKNQVLDLNVGEEFSLQIPLTKKVFTLASQVWSTFQKKHRKNKLWVVEKLCDELKKLSQEKTFESLLEEIQFSRHLFFLSEQKTNELTYTGELVYGMAIVKYFETVFQGQLKAAYDNIVQSAVKRSKSNLDWYLEFVKVESIEGMNNVPQIQEIDDELTLCVEQIDLSEQILSDQQYVKKLFFERIRADVLGVGQTKFLRQSYGDSLRVDSEDVNMIQTVLSEKKKSYFQTIDIIKERNLECNGNFHIPSWMQARIIRSNLIFSGVPDQIDDREMKIIIQDSDGFRLSSFLICVRETIFYRESKNLKESDIFN